MYPIQTRGRRIVKRVIAHCIIRFIACLISKNRLFSALFRKRVTLYSVLRVSTFHYVYRSSAVNLLLCGPTLLIETPKKCVIIFTARRVLYAYKMTSPGGDCKQNIPIILVLRTHMICLLITVVSYLRENSVPLMVRL